MLAEALAPPRRASRAARSAPSQAEPAALLRDGGVIADGYDAELDELRAIQRRLRRLPARARGARARAHRHRQPAVEYNRVHGFYIEVTQGQRDKVPADYRRRQTLKNAERYITPELKAFEDKALSAQERALAREKLLYEQLLDALAPHIPALQRAGARARARSTCSRALAERARALDWSRARVRRRAAASRSSGGRHPVVEAAAGRSAFIANDSPLDAARRMLVITGPNMGGKSTYMRQVALIALLAHCGSFVPARRARLGPIDAIYTRIGAADDLAGGRSTFMVEMTEAAHILHHATTEQPGADGRDRPRHLDLRRPGARRGRSRATCREERARFTLFATHYFELTALAARATERAPTCTSTRSSTSDRHRVPARESRTARRAAATACRSRASPACPPR